MTDWAAHFERASFGVETLPAKMFKLTPDEAAKALAEAYRRVTGRKPSKAILILLLAQTAFETGHWNLPNYNWGGVKYVKGKDGFNQYLKCGEVENGVEIIYPAGDPHCIFAAYKTAADGAERYVRTLKNRPHWWAGLQTGNVQSFVKALSTPPVYFTANPTVYLNNLVSIGKKYKALADKYGISTWLQVWFGIMLGSGLMGGAYAYTELRKRP